MRYWKVAMASWRTKAKKWKVTVVCCGYLEGSVHFCQWIWFVFGKSRQWCLQDWTTAVCANVSVKDYSSQCCLAVAMASCCASSKENSSAYTFIIFKPCPYNMALFLKMKSINESEIQESTSPCASHVHIQHLETHNIYFWQTSTGILMSETTFQQGSLVN